MLKALLQNLLDNGGFARDTDVAKLAELDRLRQLLVRCGNGRFTCAAQDVAHFIGILERDGQDYVRDVSLPASDPAWRGDFHKLTYTPPEARPFIPSPARIEAGVNRYFDETQLGGSFDGFNVTSDADPGL